MKKIITMGLALLMSSYMVAQNVTVPEPALASFNKYYNGVNAENVEWTKTANGFEVNYEFNYKQRITKFNEAGSVVENWILVDAKRLDDDVQEYLTTNYPNATIVQGYELTSNTAPQRAVVDIEIAGETFQLKFRPNGEFYTKTKI